MDNNIISSRFPVRFLCMALVLTGAVVFWLARNSHTSYHVGSERLERNIKLGRLRGTIEHLDEVLTMSAYMASHTGDPAWEERYRKYEPKLNEAFEEAIRLSSGTVVGEAALKTMKAHIKLVDLEDRVFEHVGRGELNKAQKILLGEQYGSQKLIYAEGMEVFSQGIEKDEEAITGAKHDEIHRYNHTIGIALVVLLAGWLLVLRSLGGWRRELVQKGLQLEQEIAERKRASDKIAAQLEHINALHAIDMAITASHDLSFTLDLFLEKLTSLLKLDAAAVLLINPHDLTFEHAADRGFRTDSIKQYSLRLGQGLPGLVAEGRKPVVINELTTSSGKIVRKAIIEVEQFKTYIGAPLIIKGKVKGVLELFHRSAIEPSSEQMRLLDSLIKQVSIAIDNATMFDDLQRSHNELIIAYDSTIEGWSRALDYRDSVTEGHSQRVTGLTLQIAREMGMSENQLVHIRRGALLHDIGKLGVPDNILLKNGKLNARERKILQRHSDVAKDLLFPIAFLRPAIDIPYYHHEKWDGSGYPTGLSGENIPLSARIFSVVDVWDALCSDRPYRSAWPVKKVIKQLKTLSGKDFDPRVVEIFLKMDLPAQKNASKD